LALFAASCAPAIIAIIFVAIPWEKSTSEVLAEADRLLRVHCVEKYGAANLTWCLDRIKAAVQRDIDERSTDLKRFEEQQKRAARR
jgi:hypothetical protein